MSRKQTDGNTIRIQFAVKQGEIDFNIIETILEHDEYKHSIKSTSIKLALKDLLHIFKTTGTNTSSELIKKFFEKNNPSVSSK